FILLRAQQILGEVELGPPEPTRARHFVGALQDLVPFPRRTDPAESPYGCPECLGLSDGPLIEGRIILDPSRARLLHPGYKAGDVGLHNAGGGRGPEKRVHKPFSWPRYCSGVMVSSSFNRCWNSSVTVRDSSWLRTALGVKSTMSSV